MAKRSFQQVNWTPGATADATNLANGSFMALQGGSATQLLNVIEIYEAGMAGASSPTFMEWSRASTNGANNSALAAPASDGPLSPATAALAAPPVSFTAVAGGTGPQRSNATTDARLQLGLNAFGGIVRWVAAPGEEWGILGTATPLGESLLSAFTGGTVGAINSHVIYEPFVWLLAALPALHFLLEAFNGIC